MALNWLALYSINISKVSRFVKSGDTFQIEGGFQLTDVEVCFMNSALKWNIVEQHHYSWDNRATNRT